jgi:putative aminopeptidase FrvX
MEQKQLNKLKELLSIPTYTWEEDLLIEYVINEISSFGDNISFYQDNLGSLYITKGESETYPCLVAHLDSVHRRVEMVVNEEMKKNSQGEDKLALKAYEKHSGNPTGIGGDDKSGVFICLSLLQQLDTCKVFLPVAEETGCNGSREADPKFFENVGYAIQFDSTENDTMSKSLMGVPLYEEKSDFFKSVENLILEHGVTKWLHHPYTDTMMLKKKFNFPCLNFAAGYYQYHTSNEYVIVDDVRNAILLGKKVVDQLGNVQYNFRYTPKPYDSYLL